MGHMQDRGQPRSGSDEADHRQLLDERIQHGVRVVLVVDDEQDILGSLKTFLEGCLAGVKVITATSGQEALEIMEAIDPSLIIADYRMPGMDGVALLETVAERRPGLPRVLMTAYPDLDVAVDAKNLADVDRFLTKPLEPLEIVALIYDLLQARHREIERETAYRRALELLADAPPPEEA